MIQAFTENPILLLFVVAGLGYGIGSIRIRGSSLGVAAVLFVGLIFGGLSPQLRIPDTIIFLGLSMFVYTVGLGSGPSFFATFQQRGTRDIIFVFTMLTFSALLTVGLHYLFQFDAITTAGLFAGSSTNTPALAGLLDAVNNAAGSQENAALQAQLAVVGYSLSYPMGVLGVMIAINLVERLLKIDFRKEEEALKKDYVVRQNITSLTVAVKHENVIGIPIRDLKRTHNMAIVFGRIQRGEETFLSNWDTQFQLGDKVAMVGDKEEVDRIGTILGDALPYKLSYDQTAYETKQIFVSNPDITGEKIAALNLQEKFAAIITRVRRGDIDLLADSNTVIELGDRVRFVSRRKDIQRIAAFFGDSYESLSRINLLSFGLGIAAGLLLGMITFQLPGGLSFKLGYAGGPLIVALILGALRRTGPLVWTLPYGANLSLRQIGLIFLLAGVGVNSGHTFMGTLSQGEGGWIFLAGTIISFLTAVFTLVIGYKILNIPFSFLMGMVANQPAILDFALDKTQNKLPNIGFTLILPISLITKILYVQILFAVLS